MDTDTLPAKSYTVHIITAWADIYCLAHCMKRIRLLCEMRKPKQE